MKKSFLFIFFCYAVISFNVHARKHPFAEFLQSRDPREVIIGLMNVIDKKACRKQDYTKELEQLAGIVRLCEENGFYIEGDENIQHALIKTHFLEHWQNNRIFMQCLKRNIENNQVVVFASLIGAALCAIKAHKAIKDYTFKGPKYMLLEIEGVTCSGVLDQCTRIGVQAYLPDEIFPLVNALIEITLSNQRSNSIINPNTRVAIDIVGLVNALLPLIKLVHRSYQQAQEESPLTLIKEEVPSVSQVTTQNFVVNGKNGNFVVLRRNN